MLDKYLHCDVERISPESPVPVAKVTREEARVGGAGNVAVNCATLGAEVSLLGVTGIDQDANCLLDLLRHHPIEICMPPQVDANTISKQRVISQGQQLIRLDRESRVDLKIARRLQSFFSDALGETDVVVFSDYGKGSLEDVRSFIAQANKSGKLTIVDPKGTNFERYSGACIITPNFSEFTSVVGACRDEAEIIHKARSLIREHEVGGILVTRSEQGMMYIDAEGEAFSVPTQVRDVFDVTGAGDTVVAGLAVAIAAGRTRKEAIVIANHCAGVVVGKVGTASVSLGELNSVLYAQRGNTLVKAPSGLDPFEKIVSLETIKQIRKQTLSEGKTLVMTNGCFDILHAGHVNYLNDSAKRGDVLVVAVNSDDSVRALKGSSRPINSLKERMMLLASLQCVDWVVSFAEETPLEIYREVLPDILIKGSDYEDQYVVGSEDVVRAGGRVELIDLLDGYSTSRIISKIEDRKK